MNRTTKYPSYFVSEMEGGGEGGSKNTSAKQKC